MSLKRNIIVREADGQSIHDIPVEIVERKGVGHPDSLCDGIAERISVDYCRWCLENLGILLHHNFDKVQLVAGESEVGYGGGYMIKPIHLQIAGRGTPVYNGRKIPVDEIAIHAAQQYVRETMRCLDPNKHMVIDSFVGRGSGDLQFVVNHVMANDTSYGVSHWPRSPLEETVYETTQYINHELMNQMPLGEDVKVMGLRQNDKTVLIVSVPFTASNIQSVTVYQEVKEAVREAIHAHVIQLHQREADVIVNAGDDIENNAVYLTITGTSAEMGDDGAVGRGNRINGVTAPFRSTSLEAPCGKNPISHVGKLYNLLALFTAQDIVKRIPTVCEATVYLLSRIGAPLDQPLVANALVRMANGILTPDIAAEVERILDDRLANIVDLRNRLLNREVSLF